MDTSGRSIRLLSLSSVLLCLSLTVGSGSAAALTVDEFLLLDNTLYLNSDLELTSARAAIRRDYGRRALRELGVRATHVRAMVRMGRRIDYFIRGVRRSDTIRDLRGARMLQLRRDLRIARIGRDVRMGRYLFARNVRDARQNLYAYFGVYKNNQLVWSITDASGDNIFAMASRAAPLPASWILFIVGLGGLLFVTRRRHHRD